MMGEILTLPLRLSFRAASLALRGGEQIAERGLAIAVQAVGIIRPGSDAAEHATSDTWEPPAEAESAPEPAEAEIAPEPTPAERAPEPEERAAETMSVERADAIDLEAPPEEEPIHVSEEPELAAELAEPGAEEGAGAEVRIEEPWPGYSRLNAEELISRLTASDPAELAAIQLYESAHQRRQTVLSAVERQLALSNRGS
jgi:hypothetical protein